MASNAGENEVNISYVHFSYVSLTSDIVIMTLTYLVASVLLGISKELTCHNAIFNINVTSIFFLKIKSGKYLCLHLINIVIN